MQRQTTLTALLAAGANDATALHAPGGAPLSYRALRAQVGRTIATLNALGIGRGDRVAIVLPNGPEMAAAFVGIAAGCASCPLNPAYRADEFEFYLADLNAKALVVERGSSSPAVEVARKAGVRIIELVPGSEGSGSFTLSAVDGAAGTASANGGPSQANDLALILHTSGTTSRPKIVPLTQANVCASAYNIVDTLQLTAADRALNIMPLFHIHGLMAGTLAPLAAGSTIFCTPGFNALKFFAQMAECKPTWYTAVPTMHQTILARAPANKQTIDANPLPPAVRKPGTVGRAAGPQIAIMDAAGELLPAGGTGEIVIRGPNVTPGYENNPKANSEAFTHGWFRTGDQGMLDADGYLSITGRLKEIINRGGEKISPREVDEVLMDHPAVAQVVTFAIPHDKLGEEVGAVVVLREGKDATDRELRDFLSQRLADYKVPRKIVFMDEIPKGATGKLQRIGLAAKLGLA